MRRALFLGIGIGLMAAFAIFVTVPVFRSVPVTEGKFAVGPPYRR